MRRGVVIVQSPTSWPEIWSCSGHGFPKTFLNFEIFELIHCGVLFYKFTIHESSVTVPYCTSNSQSALDKVRILDLTKTILLSHCSMNFRKKRDCATMKYKIQETVNHAIKLNAIIIVIFLPITRSVLISEFLKSYLTRDIVWPQPLPLTLPVVLQYTVYTL